ncbi:MAG: M28 family metallopeptidase [Bacteroidota bacterium]
MKFPVCHLLPFFLISCLPPGNRATEMVAIDSLSLKYHVENLASDEFQGRKPFTTGEVKTVNYLKRQFEAYGLEPGNGSSYFQDVPMVEIGVTPSNTMKVSGGEEELELNLSEEFVAYTEQVVAQTALKDSDLVFAGYGVVAPEYGWNDYEGVDVKGKTVMVLVNDPGFASGNSTLFKGKSMTYYGRWTYKYEEAARQGAAGCFIVHETVPAGYPWLVVRNSWSGSSLHLATSGGKHRCAVQGWVSREAARQIFEVSDQDLRNYAEKARTKGFQAVSLGLDVTVSLQNDIKKDVSKNVVAKITGSKRPEETIIYSAHWDHLGIGSEIDQDSIYNGAHDNATGIAALLGIAEAFVKAPKPERTVVFIAVTAEEQGLLGSKYYAENPIYDVSQTIANINMDGITYFGPMKDLTIIGYGQSEMDDLAEMIARKHGRYIIPDPDAGKGYFFRSDHFNFAKIGIPALYASGSYEHMTKGIAYITKRNKEYLSSQYHRPQDEYDEKSWRFDGMALDAQLLYEVGSKLANSDLRPRWKEGSEFKSIRE